MEKLILSQEDQPQTLKSLREIEMDTGIPKSTVNRIVKRDLLHLKPVRLVKEAALTEDHKWHRLACCKRFLQRFTIRKLAKTFFTDEKIFEFQKRRTSHNDCVYVPADQAKKDVDPARVYVQNLHGIRCIYAWKNITSFH